MLRRIVQSCKRWLSYPDELQSLLARDLATLARRRAGPLRILDVGCGTTSMLAGFNRLSARASCRLVGLDAHGPTIDWCRAHGFHDDYVLADARDEGAIPDVDVIVATDLVEHFEKREAFELIALFERKATTAVIVFTPNGYVFNPFTPENPYMEHKCGFTVDEFASLNYVCTGLGGPRQMRREQSLPRGPKVLALPVLAVVSRLMRRLPRHSFHLLARKTTGTA